MPLRNTMKWVRRTIKTTHRGAEKAAERFRQRNPTDILRHEEQDRRVERMAAKDARNMRKAIASTATRMVLFKGQPINKILPRRALSFLYTMSVELLEQTHTEKVVQDNIRKKFGRSVPEEARQKIQRQEERTREIMDVIFTLIPNEAVAHEYMMELMTLSHAIYLNRKRV